MQWRLNRLTTRFAPPAVAAEQAGVAFKRTPRGGRPLAKFNFVGREAGDHALQDRSALSIDAAKDDRFGDKALRPVARTTRTTNSESDIKILQGRRGR